MANKTWLADAIKERRFKIFYLSEDFALTMLNMQSIDAECHFRLPIIRDLPADAHVMSIHHCFDRRALAITVCHPSFDRTLGNAQLTVGGDVIDCKFIKVRPADIRDAFGKEVTNG